MNKFLFRKEVLIIWGIIEVILGIFAAVMLAKKLPYEPQGTIIDSTFLSNLVQFKYYDAFQDTAVGLFAFFSIGLITCTVGYVKSKRKNSKPMHEKIIVMGVFFAPLAGIGIFTTPINKNLSIKSDQPAFVQSEFLVDKNLSKSRKSTYYYFTFSSGNRKEVKKDEFFVTPLGKIFYIAYQGNLPIGFYPADKYQLPTP